MASTITPTQVRYNDPYQQTIFDFNTVDSKVYLSRESNKLLNVLGTNLVLKGCAASSPSIVIPSTVRTTINTGAVIQDETLIELLSTSTVDIDCSALVDTPTGGAHLVVFLGYTYLETAEANLASVDMFYVLFDGTVVDPLGRYTSAKYKVVLDVIDFSKVGTNVVSATTNASPTINIGGTTMYKRGLDPANMTMSSLISDAASGDVDYLMKRDYLLMQ